MADSEAVDNADNSERPVVIFGIVQVRPTSKAKRDRELHNSEVRSHAMKVVHQRRRDRKAASKKDDKLPEETTALSPQPAKLPPSSPSLAHGNSDPFQSSGGIELTPELSYCVRVWKDFYSPRLHINRFALNICGKQVFTPDLALSSQIAGAEFLSVELSVADELEYLGGWAAVQLYSLWHTLPESIRPRLMQVFYQTRQILLQKLRKHLSQSDIDGYNNRQFTDVEGHEVQELLMHTARLLRISCVEGDADGARIHGRIGTYLTQDLPEASARSLRAATVAVLCDVEPAARYMRRPLLGYNYDGWNHQRLQPYWAYCQTILPIGDMQQATHMSVGSRVVREALETTRACAKLCQQALVTQNTEAHIHIAYRYAMTKSYFTVGQLLNNYHDLGEGLLVSSSPEGANAAQTATQTLRHMEMALTLTALYILRKCTVEVIVDGKDIHDISHLIFPLLQESLGKGNYPMYGQATFWMLFCGAHHERRVEQGLARQSDPPLSNWFRTQFTKKALELKIRNWGEARNILIQFAHLDFLQPTEHATWFAEITRQFTVPSTDAWTSYQSWMLLR